MDKSQKRNPLKTHGNCEKYIEIQGYPELPEDALEILGRNTYVGFHLLQASTQGYCSLIGHWAMQTFIQTH